MTPQAIKDATAEWITEMRPMNLTVGDVMMFAFDKVVSGEEVAKAVFSLANEGFLHYIESTVMNPITGKPIPCFRKNN